jgi:hypothetical protein
MCIVYVLCLVEVFEHLYDLSNITLTTIFYTVINLEYIANLYGYDQKLLFSHKTIRIRTQYMTSIVIKFSND